MAVRTKHREIRVLMVGRVTVYMVYFQRDNTIYRVFLSPSTLGAPIFGHRLQPSTGSLGKFSICPNHTGKLAIDPLGVDTFTLVMVVFSIAFLSAVLSRSNSNSVTADYTGMRNCAWSSHMNSIPLILRPALYLWWRIRDSNPSPLHCQRSALPNELRPHV